MYKDARAGVRYWAEHVESKANVSDGPSRNGVADEYVTRLGAVWRTPVIPDFHTLVTAPLEALRAWLDTRELRE